MSLEHVSAALVVPDLDDGRAKARAYPLGPGAGHRGQGWPSAPWLLLHRGTHWGVQVPDIISWVAPPHGPTGEIFPANVLNTRRSVKGVANIRAVVSRLSLPTQNLRSQKHSANLTFAYLKQNAFFFILGHYLCSPLTKKH